MGKPKVRVVIDTPNRKAVYAAIGVKGNVIPPDLEGTFPGVILTGRRGELLPLPPVTLHVSSSPFVWDDANERRNTSAHRVHVDCPNCGYRVPFGRLQMHYTTAVCDTVAERRKACPLEAETQRYYAGKVPGGYAVLILEWGEWHLQRFYSTGKPNGRKLSGDWREADRFSMLATQPAAFFDWIQEQSSEVPERFREPKAVSALEAFAVSFRPVSWDECQSLQQWYGNRKLGIPHGATEAERREIMRQERKEAKANEYANRERLKLEFPWIA